MKLSKLFIVAMILAAVSCKKESYQPVKQEDTKKVFFRIKSEDVDGKVLYSHIVTQNI